MVQEILGLHGSLSKFINVVVDKLNCLQCTSCLAHLVVNLMHPTLLGIFCCQANYYVQLSLPVIAPISIANAVKTFSSHSTAIV